ncbi:hypothetical protein GCM10022261_04830 [Brevibacterium daeguense]|uniref:Uncharacterized protein n=1 Tax=Brevibacterium daeguense TaxID=909936 RepID=A0ABP8EG39_9MICO|nr:hypothetical protein [Brevibacterium daeguense]
MPEALIETYKRWDRAGRPTQVASTWNPEIWIRGLPEYAEFFEDLGSEGLDRVQAVEKSPEVVDEETAVRVFLLAMLWGYGRAGYGPFRTKRILDRPEAKAELLEVAQVAQQEGGLAAFARVAERRQQSREFLKWLGPAFGTKYIYFVTAKHPELQPAPVMDAVVDRWFGTHAPGRRIVVNDWDTRSYQTFLDSLTEWAEAIDENFGHDIRIDDVEYMIFAEGSRFEGNTWSESWDAEQREIPAPLLFDQLRALASASSDEDRAEKLIEELEDMFGPFDESQENAGS